MSILRYTRTAMLLHWLMAVLILGLFGLGIYMADLPLSPQKLKLLQLSQVGRHHGSAAGSGPHSLAHQPQAAHLCPPHSRNGNSSPPMPAIAFCTVLIFAAPLTGWLMSSALGFPVVWFGVLPLPDLIDKNKELGEVLKLVHSYLNYAFIAVVTGHALAAIKHQWLDRDGTLSRICCPPHRRNAHETPASAPAA